MDCLDEASKLFELLASEDDLVAPTPDELSEGGQGRTQDSDPVMLLGQATQRSGEFCCCVTHLSAVYAVDSHQAKSAEWRISHRVSQPELAAVEVVDVVEIFQDVEVGLPCLNNNTSRAFSSTRPARHLD